MLTGGGSDLKVSVLIGSDYYFKFMSGRCIRGVEDSPVALESSIGWVLSGPMKRWLLFCCECGYNSCDACWGACCGGAFR